LTAPFVLLQFFVIGLTNVDKVIIPQLFQDKTELAVYGLAFQIGYLLPTVATSLVTVTQPIIYKLLSDFNPLNNIKLKKIIAISYVVVIIAGLMVYFFTPFFYRVFIKDPRYDDGIPLVGFLLLAWLLWCCGSFLIDIIKKLGTRKQIVSSYFIPFVLLVACLYIFGSQYGLRGITYSLIISYGSILIILAIFARRQLRLLLLEKSQPAK
jgi:O-antigen/teichoic acid export membrane protein